MTGTDLILRDTGEVIRMGAVLDGLANRVDVALTEDADSQATMLEALRRLESETARMKRLLSDGLAEHARAQGTQTLILSDGRKAIVSKGERTTVDPQKLADGLRRAGMPEDVVNEIVSEVVTSKVDLRRAQRAAGSNLKYARALKRASTVTEEPVTVSVKRG